MEGVHTEKKERGMYNTEQFAQAEAAYRYEKIRSDFARHPRHRPFLRSAVRTATGHWRHDAGPSAQA